MIDSPIGKIYQLAYPYTDASRIKNRPVVIVIEDGEDFEVLYITTKTSGHVLPIEPSDIIHGGLQETSYVKITRSMLFDQSLFTESNYIATLSVEKVKHIIKKVIEKYEITLAELESIS